MNCSRHWNWTISDSWRNVTCTENTSKRMAISALTISSCWLINNIKVSLVRNNLRVFQKNSFISWMIAIDCLCRLSWSTDDMIVWWNAFSSVSIDLSGFQQQMGSFVHCDCICLILTWRFSVIFPLLHHKITMNMGLGLPIADDSNLAVRRNIQVLSRINASWGDSPNIAWVVGLTVTWRQIASSIVSEWWMATAFQSP